MQLYPTGLNQVLPERETIYISLMTDGDVDLIIKGARYEFDVSNFFKKKIYPNNGFLDQPIVVTSEPGYLVVIQSKDR